MSATATTTTRKRVPIEPPQGTPLETPSPSIPDAPPPTREQLLHRCRAARAAARHGHRGAGATNPPPVTAARSKDITKAINSLKAAKDPATKDALAQMSSQFINECGCDVTKFCEKYNIQPEAVPAIQKIAESIAAGMPVADAIAVASNAQKYK